MVASKEKRNKLSRTFVVFLRQNKNRLFLSFLGGYNLNFDPKSKLSSSSSSSSSNQECLLPKVLPFSGQICEKTKLLVQLHHLLPFDSSNSSYSNLGMLKQNYNRFIPLCFGFDFLNSSKRLRSQGRSLLIFHLLAHKLYLLLRF